MTAQQTFSFLRNFIFKPKKYGTIAVVALFLFIEKCV